jgi:hypothetical protein
MSGQIAEVKELFRGCVENLRMADECRGGALGEILFRVRMCQNAILENERKIWLRTSEGRSLLGSVASSIRDLDDTVSKYLRESTEKQGDAIVSLMEKVENLEHYVIRLKEEIGRRQMVVT